MQRRIQMDCKGLCSAWNSVGKDDMKYMRGFQQRDALFIWKHLANSINTWYISILKGSQSTDDKKFIFEIKVNSKQCECRLLFKVSKLLAAFNTEHRLYQTLLRFQKRLWLNLASCKYQNIMLEHVMIVYTAFLFIIVTVSITFGNIRLLQQSLL